MKRVIFLVFLSLAIIAGSAYAKTDKKKADDKSNKPTKGYVASLKSIMSGGDGKVTSVKAKELVSNCDPLVLAVGSGKKIKVYFIYLKDGSFAEKKLADYADAKAVGVFGKIISANGMNMISADAIKPMD